MPISIEKVRVYASDPLCSALKSVFQAAQDHDVSIMKSVNRFRKLHAQQLKNAKDQADLILKDQGISVSSEEAVQKLERAREKAEIDFWKKFRFLLQLPITLDRGFEANNLATKYLEITAKLASSMLDEQRQKFKDNKSTASANDTQELQEECDNPTPSVEAEDDYVELPAFFRRLIHWLLDNHEVEGNAARQRITLMINHLLKLMGEDASIDDDLYNKIYDNMLLRLRDKVVDIRSQAVMALQRLQDPKDNACPIINAFLFHLANDPSPLVRRAVVRSVGASRFTLPHILKRTKDVDEGVRKAAFKFIAEKVHIRSLTIAQREQILKRGLSDRSEGVRNIVEGTLVPAWLSLNDKKIVQLLYSLDVGNSEDTKVASNILKVLFRKVPYMEITSNFEYIDSSKLVPFDKLTPEVAVYWNQLTSFLYHEGGAASEFLEKLLPELTRFCQYVRKYILEVDKSLGSDDDDDITWLFVSKQLIEMFGAFDLADEMGRKNLLKLCKELLVHKRTTTPFIEPLMNIYSSLCTNVDTRITEVAEIISELRDPMIVDESKSKAGSLDSSMTEDAMNERKAIEKAHDAQNRKKQVEIAKVRVNMNIAKDDLDKAIESQDFIRAQELKTELKKLEEEQIKLQEELMEAAAMAAKPPSPKGQTTLTQTQELTTEKSIMETNPVVLHKCLEIIMQLLQEAKICSLNPTLLTLMDELIKPAIRNQLPDIRKTAVRALGACCNRNVDVAKQHILVLFQIGLLDQQDVRLCALAMVNDLLMYHGISTFVNDTADDEPSNIDSFLDSEGSYRHDLGLSLTQADMNLQGNSVVATLTRLLDDPDLEIRTKVAEGLCKLMMIGAVASPKLFQRLILIWFNPLAEVDGRMRHILGTFFPLYASMKRMNQDIIEEAFMPTMQTLIAAPATSPLSSIDLEDVGLFFIQITREDFLQCKDTVGPNVHDNMAFSLCKEVLGKPETSYARSFIKLLLQLQISPSDFPKLRELLHLQERMTTAVRDKQLLKRVEKFGQILTDWLKADPNPSNDEAAVEEPHTEPQQAEESGMSNNASLNLTKLGKRRHLFNHNSTTLMSPALKKSCASSDDIDSASSSELILSPKPPTLMMNSQRGGEVTRVEETSDESEDEVIVSGGNLPIKSLPSSDSPICASQDVTPIASSTQVPNAGRSKTDPSDKESQHSIRNFIEKDAEKTKKKLQKMSSETEDDMEEETARRKRRTTTQGTKKKVKTADSPPRESVTNRKRPTRSTTSKTTSEEEGSTNSRTRRSVRESSISNSNSTSESTRKSSRKKNPSVKAEESSANTRGSRSRLAALKETSPPTGRRKSLRVALGHRVDSPSHSEPNKVSKTRTRAAGKGKRA